MRPTVRAEGLEATSEAEVVAVADPGQPETTAESVAGIEILTFGIATAMTGVVSETETGTGTEIGATAEISAQDAHP
jgi:hypothetical protein